MTERRKLIEKRNLKDGIYIQIQLERLKLSVKNSFLQMLVTGQLSENFTARLLQLPSILHRTS